MTPAETAIRARRKLTNKLIAARDASRLRPFLDPSVKLVAGDGSLMVGVDAVLAAFDAQFHDPAFVAYVRTTEGVQIDEAGHRAAESGAWVGTWRGSSPMSGIYLAVWKKTIGQWILESELYVTLSQGGQPTSAPR